MKVKLIESFEEHPGGCEPIEFDVSFAGLPLASMDATVNWKESGVSSNGIFYTDSNGLGIVKRVRKEVVGTVETVQSLAPANYYPVSTAI